MRLLERNAKGERKAFLEGDLLPTVFSLFDLSHHYLNYTVGRLVAFVSNFGMWLVPTSSIMRLPGNNWHGFNPVYINM